MDWNCGNRLPLVGLHALVLLIWGGYTMIDVLLIEDQRLFSEGIQAVMNREEDIRVLAIATNEQEAIEKINQIKIDIVLMDVHLHNIEGIKMTLKIKESFPEIKVILLTATVDEDLVVNGLSVGADGFLLMSLYAENVTRAIRDTYQDQMVLSGEIAKILAKKIQELKFDKKQILTKKLKNRSIKLTDREVDIAYLLMEGHSNKAIAQKLYLSEGTIKNYVSGMYGKLKLRNRAEVSGFLNGLF